MMKGIFLSIFCISLAALQGCAYQTVGLAGSSHSGNHTVVKVLYSTDRKEEQKSTISYTTERGEMSYGVCDVSIPDTHTLGEMESPSFWRLEFRDNPDKHIVLMDISKTDKISFDKILSTYLSEPNGNNILLFVHGFNVSFKDAARRTAQLAFDLHFKGVPLFYSWPSQESVIKYKIDEINNAWAQADFDNFIVDLLNKTDANTKVFIIAHSMGNRLVTQAIKELKNNHKQVLTKLKEVILAAPDIDTDTFKAQIAPKILDTAFGVSLYTSDHDEAILASQLVNKYSRVGNIKDGVVIYPGIYTIDASDADTSFLGHGYYAENTRLLSDIYNIFMHTGKPPRFGLDEIKISEGVYWKLMK